MDQLKTAFAVIKKYHFWILCLLILVLYLGTWFMATSSMTEETDTRVSKITSAYSNASRIAGVTNHPNDQTIEMMNALTRAEAEQVRLSWEMRYREQEDVLVWPQELLPDFIAAVEPLKPIELKVKYPTPASEELSAEFRSRYRDYIRDELPKLAKIIGAVWHATSSGGGGMMGGMGGMGGGGSMMPGMGGGGSMMPGMGGGGSMMPGMGSGGSMMPGMGSGGSMMPGMGSGGSMMPGMGSGGRVSRDGDAAESRIVVEWSPANQAALQAASFSWTYPTTLQVLYAQEDLWILRSLMLVIKGTNGDADAQYNAAVKEILALDLGAAAAGIKQVGSIESGKEMGGGGAGAYPGMGTVMDPANMMGAGSAGGSASGSGSDSGSGSGSAGSGGGSAVNPYTSMGSGSGGAARSIDPASGRYVDDKMESLTGDRLRTAMASNQPADAFLAVAKRMPVRLRFKMNVLKLPLLLCELANARLPVEVRQVRINAPAGASGGFGGMMPGGSGMPSGAGTPMGAGGGSSMSLGGGGGSMMPGMGSGGSMMPGMGSGGSMMPGMGSGGSTMPGRGGTGQQNAGMTDSPYDATVEIYGLIYIYNPVDPVKLGLDDKKAPAGDATAAASAESADETAVEETEGVDETDPVGAQPADMGADDAAAPDAAAPDAAATDAADAAAAADTTQLPPAADTTPPAPDAAAEGAAPAADPPGAPPSGGSP